MPKYKKADPSHIISRHELEDMLNVLRDPRDRALLVLLYVFGPRPSEVLEMTTEDVEVTPTSIVVRIPTKKIKSKDKFEVIKREIAINRPHPRDWVLEELVNYVGMMKQVNPGGRLFTYNARQRIWDVVNRASTRALGYALTPYNFRHSRLTKLARSGATVDELMYWKGARSVKSVSPYLHARPVKVDLSEIDKE